MRVEQDPCTSTPPSSVHDRPGDTVTEYILRARLSAGCWGGGGEQDRADPLFSFFLEEPDDKQGIMGSDSKHISHLRMGHGP